MVKNKTQFFPAAGGDRARGRWRPVFPACRSVFLYQ
jgi:hypothetical protein